MQEIYILCVFKKKLRSLDTDDLFKRTPGVYEKQAVVTGNKVKHSVSVGGNNPVLLQQEE